MWRCGRVGLAWAAPAPAGPGAGPRAAAPLWGGRVWAGWASGGLRFPLAGRDERRRGLVVAGACAFDGRPGVGQAALDGAVFHGGADQGAEDVLDELLRCLGPLVVEVEVQGPADEAGDVGEP